MTKKIKLLFFTPYAGYTGSEMMLWYLLSSIDKTKFEVKLIAGKKGDLLSEFPNTVDVDYLRTNTSLLYRIVNKILKKLNFTGLDERRILKLHTQFTPDFWYINTMAMYPIVDLAIKHQIKYFVHFHELLSQYASIGSQELQQTVTNAFCTVGCAEDVCANLKTLGSKRIQKQYECVDFSKIKTDPDKKLILREKHGIKITDFLIVMSGQRIERKGFDIFVETAIRLKNSAYHFIWLGASKNSGYEFFLERAIKEHGLKNITLLAPEHQDYYNYFNLADLFFLTSREDPFPLVMLEAAFLGKPILAFNSGGSKEFVIPTIGKLMKEISASVIDKEIEWMIQEIAKNTFVEENIQEHAKQYDAINQVRLFQNWLSELTKN